MKRLIEVYLTRNRSCDHLRMNPVCHYKVISHRVIVLGIYLCYIKKAELAITFVLVTDVISHEYILF
jgi:hypothetical protein